MPKRKLASFFEEACKERGLTLRGLSVSAGLSPSTVHNIIKREYQPTLFTLNRLADFLGVRREYLWQLAGLLEDMDYKTEPELGDPQLRYHLAQVDKLPRPARNLIISIIAAITAYLESAK